MGDSDNLDGPCMEYKGNPVIKGPSTPDIRWIKEEKSSSFGDTLKIFKLNYGRVRMELNLAMHAWVSKQQISEHETQPTLEYTNTR